MKKWFALCLVGLSVALPVLAEENPPQTPTPPRMGDERHRGEMRGFAMHSGGMDESARILPPGPWWKDQDLVKRIELTPDQQKRIEDLFLQNKIELIHMHASLDEEELLLAPMLDANPVDQAKTLAQISKIADTRAALEKATAKMLLQIRAVLNQQQWTKLQQERQGMRQHMFRTPGGSFRGPDGGHSMNRFGQNGDRMRDQMRGGMPGPQPGAPADAPAQP